MTTLQLKKVQGNKRTMDFSKVLYRTILLLQKLQGSKRIVEFLKDNAFFQDVLARELSNGWKPDSQLAVEVV